MKQVVQKPKVGVAVEDVPAPATRGEGVLVRNRASLISAGTERDIVKAAGQSMARTAVERPDLVKRVLRMAKTQGWRTVFDKIRARLGQPAPIGYSCAGEVLTATPGSGFAVGERVACAGASYANHAEVVFVPKNLCVPVPEGVSYEEAAYVTLGAIAMQGVRQTDARVGESVVVVGLGLIGQLAVQILKAAGARVAGVDMDAAKVKLALEHGADAAFLRAGAEEEIRRFTEGRGADAVLLTASTPSHDPVEFAGEIARDRGRVVVLGAVGLAIPRDSYYRKELELRLSRSYGPGRYDPEYEERGHDYPLGYVRWTEQRNMEGFLALVAEKKVKLDKITTHRFPVEDAERAYALVKGEAKEPSMGILLIYAASRSVETKIPAAPREASAAPVKWSVFGAGNFARGVLLPALRDLKGVELRGVVTGSGLSAKRAAEAFSFAFAGSTEADIWSDSSTNAVLIATRHHLHAPLAVEALRRGKHVFVEKPLALNEEELAALEATYRDSRALLAVGFNRRFAPATERIRKHFETRQRPLFLSYRVNAGFLPPEHWVHDPKEGGGRIVGEACHFVDWILYVAGSLPVWIYAAALPRVGGGPGGPDNVSITMGLADGSVGVVQYLACGPADVAKERAEVFGEGKYALLDDFRAVVLADAKGAREERFAAQDKGHREGLRRFVEAVMNGGESPVPWEGAAAATRATFRILDSLACGEKVPFARGADGGEDL